MKAESAPFNAATDGDRTRLDGTDGARFWTGHGILAHDLVKITALAA